MSSKRRKIEYNTKQQLVNQCSCQTFDWDSLPDSICLRVFSYINFCDLILNLSYVSKKFRRLVFDRYLWRDLSLLNSKLEVEESTGKQDSRVLIKHLFHVSEFVRKVDFRYCGPISNTVLSTLSNQCLVYLQSLNLEGCTHINEKEIQRIGQTCRALTDVNLLFTAATADNMVDIFRNNSKLQCLVCHSSCLSLKALTVLASFCPALRVLHGDDGQMSPVLHTSNGREDNNTLTNEMIYEITKLTQLRVLILKYDSVCIHDDYFAILGSSCRFLECIELSYVGVNSVLTDIGITNACCFLKDLQYLHLYEFVEVTNLTLKFLANHCPVLKSLSLENGYFDDEGIITLVQGCCNLESLSIGVADNSLNDLTDKSVVALAKHCGPRLFHLHMIGWDISDKALLILAKELTHLKHLSVESCMLLTNEGFFKALEHMQGLISVDLSFTDIFYEQINSKSLKFPSTLRKIRLCGLGLAEDEILTLRTVLKSCDVREY